MRARSLIPVLALLVLAGCGASSPDASQRVNAFPLVISPNSVAAGSGAITITAQSSSGLCPSGSLLWNGKPRPTEYHAASTSIASGWSCYGIGCFFAPWSTTTAYSQATLNASDTAQPGLYQVSFSCPGGTSESVPFTVLALNPAPVLASASPSHVAHGSADTFIELNGSSFVPGVTALWNGSARPTAFGSANQLQMKVYSSDLTTTGSATITVTNPGPGGGSSSIQFVID